MITTSVSEFRKEMKKYLDQVSDGFQTIIIHKPNTADEGFVILSLQEYNSIKATQHELSSNTNEKRLDSAISKFKSGNSFSKKLIRK